MKTIYYGQYHNGEPILFPVTGGNDPRFAIAHTLNGWYAVYANNRWDLLKDNKDNASNYLDNIRRGVWVPFLTNPFHGTKQ